MVDLQIKQQQEHSRVVFAKGVDATDTLGGASGEQGGSHGSGDEFFKGDNEMFNLTVALLGKKFDPSDGTTKFVGGGSGGADGAITANAAAGSDGGDSKLVRFIKQ